MKEILGKMSFWGFFLGIICVCGVLRAWTERRKNPEPDVTAQQRMQQQVTVLREKLDEARAELDLLPPDERQTIEGALPGAYSETIKTPIMTKLLIMSNKPNKEADARASLERVRLVIRLSHWLAATGVWGLWGLVVFVVAKYGAGQVMGRAEWTEEAAILAFDMAKRWLVLLSFILAGIFAVTLENPWSRAPIVYFAAPIALIAAGAAARSRSRDDAQAAMSLLDALTAPAAGLALTLAACRAVAFVS